MKTPKCLLKALSGEKGLVDGRPHFSMSVGAPDRILCC